MKLHIHVYKQQTAAGMLKLIKATWQRQNYEPNPKFDFNFSLRYSPQKLFLLVFFLTTHLWVAYLAISMVIQSKWVKSKVKEAPLAVSMSRCPWFHVHRSGEKEVTHGSVYFISNKSSSDLNQNKNTESHVELLMQQPSFVSSALRPAVMTVCCPLGGALAPSKSCRFPNLTALTSR